MSNNINSQLGVKHGDPSSSLLFMMFLNDILVNINSDLEGIFTTDEVKLFLLAYADDQVLFSTSPTTLQSMLNNMELYFNAWGLIFEKAGSYTIHNFYLYNEQLEVVSSFKYLRVYVFKNGKWPRTQYNVLPNMR